MREIFGIPRIEGLKIADFPTINHIIAFVLERSRKAASPAPAENQGKPAETAVSKDHEIRLLETRLVRLPSLEKIPRPVVDAVIIAGAPTDIADNLDK